MYNKSVFEIERKFLIKYPDLKKLSKMDGCAILNIKQSYLADGSRIREIEQDGNIYYIKTVKKRISDIKREEKEWQIDREEYLKELSGKEIDTKTLEKTRYAVPIGCLVYEIDVFPFWSDRAFLEVELKSETEDFPIPDFLEVIKEVTYDKRYTNAALSREIINEPLNL